jgi:hypothetical protein
MILSCVARMCGAAAPIATAIAACRQQRAAVVQR